MGTGDSTESGAIGGGSGSSGATSGSAVRRPGATQTPTVLNGAYELREIVVAQGIEFNNSDMDASWHMPDGLQGWFPDMTISGTNAEYISDRQHVRFTIRVVQNKTEFKTALQTDGVHVIYAGHARFGRGPCFGSPPNPGENWEQGTDVSTVGIYRMGYPVIVIPLEDMEHHQYSFYPVASRHTVAAEWCHPHVNRSRLTRIPIADLPAALQGRVLPNPPESEFWGYRDRAGHAHDLLLWAGWTGTVSDPMDLGATNLACRCFCHYGCDTFLHNHKIIRYRKGWRRTADDRFAYFTTGTVDLPIELYWIRALFNYPHRNDYQTWYPSLQWAVGRVNSYLAGQNRRYRVI
jgi:hypothetical protein